MAKVFYDLGLMEQEGSGYDKIFEVLALSAKQPPVVDEGPDRVCVSVGSHIISKEALRFMESVGRRYDLRQRELIALGLLAQHESMTARDFSGLLELEGKPERLSSWLGRLPDFGLVTSSGRTKAKEYRVNWDALSQHPYKGPTSLKTIEPPRLRELMLTDIGRHPASSFKEIHSRIGLEISVSKVRKMKDKLLKDAVIIKNGDKRWARYSIAPAREMEQ